MEGYLCTCSLACFVNIFFLLISSTVNASQGALSEDVDQFPFPLDMSSSDKSHEKPHRKAPLQSPSGSPAVSPSPLKPYNPPGQHKKPRQRYSPPPIPPPITAKKGLNDGKMAGLVLISIAGVLQVVVLAYLLVKRRQMLRVVEKYEV